MGLAGLGLIGPRALRALGHSSCEEETGSSLTQGYFRGFVGVGKMEGIRQRHVPSQPNDPRWGWAPVLKGRIELYQVGSLSRSLYY